MLLVLVHSAASHEQASYHKSWFPSNKRDVFILVLNLRFNLGLLNKSPLRKTNMRKGTWEWYTRRRSQQVQIL